MNPLIAEARRNPGDLILQRWADALEASEAQVARLRATLVSVLHYFGPPPREWPTCEEESYASEIARALYGDPYPADLLEAVRQLSSHAGATAQEDNICDHIITDARATLTRYRLIEERPNGD